MFELAICEYSKNFKRNLFVAVLMAVVCLVIVVAGSILNYKVEQLKPFKALGVEKGYYVASMPDDIDLKNVSGIEGRYSVKYYSYYSDYDAVTIVGYDDWVWKNWQPRLSGGVWINKVESGEDCIDVVIGGNIKGLEIGDKITCYMNVGDYNTQEVSCNVVGILYPGTKVLGNNQFYAGDMNYLSAYMSVTESENEQLYLFAKQEDIVKSGLVGMNTFAWQVISFSENLSEEQLQKNENYIYAGISGAGMPYSDFIKASNDILMQDIVLYLPLLLLSIGLVGIVIYTVVRINVIKERHNYSVYYLVGADKSICVKIALVSSFINFICSVMFFLILATLFEVYAIKSNIVFYLEPGIIVAAIMIYSFMFLYTWMSVRSAFKNRYPLDVLRNR